MDKIWMNSFTKQILSNVEEINDQWYDQIESA